MNVVITGARGLVGSALARAIPGAHALGRAELDIADRAAVREVFAALRPSRVINCAVIGVDDCERNPERARRINVDGPSILAEECSRNDAALVHFSTNYVFDGEAREPYRVGDEPRPINVYGATKLDGERAVAALCPRAIVIRTSWVYGGSGKANFLSTVARKLRSGERVRAIVDTWASATYVDDLIERVLEIEDPGTYHVVNDGVCSYESFAVEAARLVGASEALIDRVTEAAMQRPARRPRYTALQNDKPLRPWQDALADFLRRS